MHRNYVLHTQKTDRTRRLVGSHGEVIADRQQRDIRLIQLTYEFHVAEQRRVPRVVHGKSSGHANHQSGWLAAIYSLAIVIDGVRVKCMGHGYVKLADSLRAAFAHWLGFFLESFALDPQARLENGHNLWPVLLRQGQQVSKM